jgi:hypothetical protein
MARYTHLQEPIEIGGRTVRNRVIMTTHGARLTQARYVPYHPFTADGRAFYDGMIPALREQSDAVKRHGVLSIALFSSRRRPTYRHVPAGGWAVGRSRRVRAPCTARSHRRGNR